jgi:putative DNA primase/helicase
MMNLKDLARALGGEVSGRAIVAPGPGHSKHDRSMQVTLDPGNADGFLVHSFSGDDWRACRDHVKALLGIDRTRPLAKTFTAPARPERPVADDVARTGYALRIWQETRSISGTPAEIYLASRGVDLARLPSGLDRALRWHPSCPWETGKHGAMVSLMTDAISGAPKAIHRTAVTAQGGKAGKKMLGPRAGCIVRLWPDEAVTTGLVVGEGIETTLVAATRLEHRETSLIPAWAACSADGMAKFPVLSGIEALTLLVDNDASGAGERAALECSARWVAADREVHRLMPPDTGVDFADIFKGIAA